MRGMRGMHAPSQQAALVTGERAAAAASCAWPIQGCVLVWRQHESVVLWRVAAAHSFGPSRFWVGWKRSLLRGRACGTHPPTSGTACMSMNMASPRVHSACRPGLLVCSHLELAASWLAGQPTRTLLFGPGLHAHDAEVWDACHCSMLSTPCAWRLGVRVPSTSHHGIA